MAALAAGVALIAAAVLLVVGSGDDRRESRAAEPAAALGGPVAALADEMSIEELADQVLLLGFDGTDASAPFLDEVRTRELGGVLVGPANWPDAAAGTALVGGLRSAGRERDRVPPLIVTSQEGGSYRALADLAPEETQLEIGATNSPAAAEQWATGAAEGLAAAGVDLNLAPLADVATLDSALADRAFSDDSAATAQLVAASVRGCRRGGVACAVAHFPGLGAASQDTSAGPATVSLDTATLAARDLPPFEAAFAAGAPAVVLSLALYAAYEPVTPGALATPVATGLLRDELGFEGLAITDDLGSGAARSSRTVAEAAVEALVAGADLLQIGTPEDQAGVREAIVDAVAAGELSEARLREAASRVLELKRAQELLEPAMIALGNAP